MPSVERRSALVPIEGSPPSLLAPPAGCPFHPRCRFRLRAVSGRAPAACRPCRTRIRTRATSRGTKMSEGTKRPSNDSEMLRERRGEWQPRRARAPDETVRREAGRVRARQRGGARGRGRVADRSPRRERRDRRRVRLRQVDDRTPDAQAARSDRRTIRFDGTDISKLSQRTLRPPGGDADDLPGSVPGPEPAQDGRPDRRRTVRDPRPEGCEDTRPGAARDRRAQPEHYNRYPHEFSGASVSGSGLERSRSHRSSSCATSRSRRSTSRSRRRS
jgi:hypothetical protein